MHDVPDDIKKAVYELIDNSEGNIHTNDWIAYRIARLVMQERQRCADIAGEILEKSAWREHWEDDHAGGANVRAKLKRLASGEI